MEARDLETAAHSRPNSPPVSRKVVSKKKMLVRWNLTKNPGSQSKAPKSSHGGGVASNDDDDFIDEPMLTRFASQRKAAGKRKKHPTHRTSHLFLQRFKKRRVDPSGRVHRMTAMISYQRGRMLLMWKMMVVVVRCRRKQLIACVCRRPLSMPSKLSHRARGKLLSRWGSGSS